MDISCYIKNNHLKILVKPNSSENKILGWDNKRQALRVAIAAVPEKGKANKEVIKFFTKLLKKQIRIMQGFKNKEKLLEIK
jgi:hypothetical protein